MKSELLKKTLVIGIILLFTTISVGSAYPTPQKNNKTAGMKKPMNYLGDIEIQHSNPIINLHFVSFKGMFNPVPPDQRDFYFPEVNGTIMMNFSINCSQRLATSSLKNRVSNWLVYVTDIKNQTDYVQSNISKTCTSINWTVFTFYMQAFKAFPTNGYNHTLRVNFYAGVTVFGVQLLYWGAYPWLPAPIRKILGIADCQFDIIVHPIKTA